jgi:hypothetical protein
MAKAKKRVAARKKSSKRGKASAKPARKKAAKRMTPKQAKSKVRGAAKRQRQSKIAARKAPSKTPRQAVEVPVEDTIIDVIEEPVPGVVVVTEYETIRTATPISSSPEPKPGVGPETEKQ